MQSKISRTVNVLFVVVVVVFLVENIWWISYTKALQKEIDLLTEENTNLYISLNKAENEAYELALEIKSTNETLAETAHLLEIAENEKDVEKILEYEYCGEYTITAYCCEKYSHICGGGNTASGTPPIPDLTCAVCDLKTFPYGTVVYIEDVGIRVVQDTGNFSKHKIDVAVSKHKDATLWKTAKHRVWIIREIE